MIISYAQSVLAQGFRQLKPTLSKGALSGGRSIIIYLGNYYFLTCKTWAVGSVLEQTHGPPRHLSDDWTRGPSGLFFF